MLTSDFKSKENCVNKNLGECINSCYIALNEHDMPARSVCWLENILEEGLFRIEKGIFVLCGNNWLGTYYQNFKRMYHKITT